ncbi:MAG TPA: RNA pyrophosphohydrolase [Verrucomicrobiales bacterium]|nr:RNA pyrophosphohydrolase [Verrucomicrobiae bacterium]MCP5552830.1 RNA pyrophosphohydrolase [Akkermansiaceae bacterium]HRX55693.1 RNA pyrophosphohydrolase [Verrucomicrobiales bacterium]
MATYRPNVAAILMDATGKILVAERIDFKGSWQFPQGGVDKGEDLIGALRREVEEELGLKPWLYQLVACRTGYRYKFPNGKVKKRLYCGQVQTYFLCRYLGTDADIVLDSHKQEFISVKWIEPKDFSLKWVPAFKRRVFLKVFLDFFRVRL